MNRNAITCIKFQERVYLDFMILNSTYSAELQSDWLVLCNIQYTVTVCLETIESE